ncbi:hypothetical protein HPP92_025378 [Vanilla planifolia]|uniref:Uncharacterized protein n=1 Tax=Vanilla planifolia TaxID=51239 RepID=A0A835PJ28_VANPL|nr:hypothetical protein HPP92_025378 [Vanilla planifolia]
MAMANNGVVGAVVDAKSKVFLLVVDKLIDGNEDDASKGSLTPNDADSSAIEEKDFKSFIIDIEEDTSKENLPVPVEVDFFQRQKLQEKFLII